MSKGLEAFEEILSSAYGLGLKMDLRNQLITIEKELKSKEKTDKVLEIVKVLFQGRYKLYERTENVETCNEAGCHAEKVATTSYILEFRNYDLHYEFHLHKEEYDLLKEVLDINPTTETKSEEETMIRNIFGSDIEKLNL